MYPSKHARELAILLRISRELDIIGDVSATVDSPSQLLAWATILKDPAITAWRAEDSGHRYVHVTADHPRAPIRGRISAVLPCEQHLEFWQALGLDHVDAGESQTLTGRDLANAWAVMPISAPDIDVEPPTPPPRSDSDADKDIAPATADGSTQPSPSSR